MLTDRILFTIVQVLALGSIAAHSSSIRDLNDYRLSLGDFLLERVESDALEPNIAKASEWLASLGSSVKVRSGIVELHQMLVLLNKVCSQDYFCGREGIELFKFLRLLDPKESKSAGQLTERQELAEARIASLLQQARRTFGFKCRAAATRSMKSIYSQMNEKVTARVKSLLEHVKKVSGQPELYSDLDDASSSPLWSIHITHTAQNLARGGLEAIAEHEEDALVLSTMSGGKPVENDLQQLVKVYISHPCASFIGLMEKPMQSIRFDELFMMNYRDYGDELNNFKEAIEMYEVCAQMRSMLSFIAPIISKLVSDDAAQRNGS